MLDLPAHFLARRKIRKAEGESPQRSVQPPVSRNVFFSVSAHQVLQVKGAYLASLPCSLANCFALCAWISSQMAAYDLSEGCSPITQTQTSLSAPSFHFTDFPLAGREVALSHCLLSALCRACVPCAASPGCCHWQSLSKSGWTWGKLSWDTGRTSHFISQYCSRVSEGDISESGDKGCQYFLSFSNSSQPPRPGPG